MIASAGIHSRSVCRLTSRLERPRTALDAIKCNQDCNHVSRLSAVVDGAGCDPQPSTTGLTSAADLGGQGATVSTWRSLLGRNRTPSTPGHVRASAPYRLPRPIIDSMVARLRAVVGRKRPRRSGRRSLIGPVGASIDGQPQTSSGASLLGQ